MHIMGLDIYIYKAKNTDSRTSPKGNTPSVLIKINLQCIFIKKMNLCSKNDAVKYYEPCDPIFLFILLYLLGSGPYL